MDKNHTKLAIFGFVALVVIILIALSITTIDAGMVGVKKLFGAVSDDILSEGIHFKAPWVNVIEIDSKAQNYKIESFANDPNAAVSKDLQAVGFSVDIAYYVNPNDAWLLVKYVGDNKALWENIIIQPAMWQGVKAILSNYGLEDIITKRDEVRIEIGESIKKLVMERLDNRYKTLGNALIITQVTLRNVDYSDEYKKVITEKQVEAQRVKAESYKLDRFKVQQQQAVVQAEQEALANVTLAIGEARAYLTKLEAEIKVYAFLQKVGFSPATYNFLEKWDGKLPNVLADSSALNGILIPAGSKDSLNLDDIQLLLGEFDKAKKNLEEEMSKLSKHLTDTNKTTNVDENADKDKNNQSLPNNE